MDYKVNPTSRGGGHQFEDDERYRPRGVIHQRLRREKKEARHFENFEALLADCLERLGIPDPRPKKPVDPAVGTHLDIKA